MLEPVEQQTHDEVFDDLIAYYTLQVPLGGWSTADLTRMANVIDDEIADRSARDEPV